MWGLEGIFKEPNQNEPMTRDQARSEVLLVAYNIEATQLALSDMSASDKAKLKSSNEKLRTEANEVFLRLKNDYFSGGDFKITTQSFAKARNDAWRWNKERLNGMDRAEFIDWVGDDDVLREDFENRGR